MGPAIKPQPLDAAIGRRTPVLNPMLRRALWSGAIAAPIALLTFAIADNPSLPDTLRYVICPGLYFGLRFATSASCSGFLGCLSTVLGQVGRMAEITFAINWVVFGLLIFTIAHAAWGAKSR